MIEQAFLYIVSTIFQMMVMGPYEVGRALGFESGLELAVAMTGKCC